MDEKRSETRVITAHVPQKLAERVDEYAARMERSRGWIVKQALADWVAWEEEKYRLTLEALESVRKVGTIPHEEVDAWARSLGTENPLPTPVPRKRL